MLFLVKNGHHHFKKELRRKDYAIKEACCVHGPPDLIHGNEPYVLIRNTAKEVLDALFNESVYTSESLQFKENRMILSGYGSSASVGKMQGFGNSFQTSENVGERIAKGFSSVMDKLLIEDRNPKLQNEYLVEGTLQYQAVKIEHQSSENSNENFNLRSEEEIKDIRKTKLQRIHMPGKAGGGWDDDDCKETQDTKDKNTGSSISKDSLEKVESIPQVDYAEEQKTVEQFTHQDASFPPTSAEIIEARNCCLRLNCDKIIDFLVQRK